MDVRDEVSVSGVWGNRDPRTIRNEIGREYACSENIDAQVERVLENSLPWVNSKNMDFLYIGPWHCDRSSWPSRKTKSL